MNVPILLVGFNRPDTLQQVFNKVKLIKPKKLYFFIDKHKSNDEQEIEYNNKCRNIIEQVNWDCNLQTLFPDENQGCGKGVSGAISWVFEKEDRVIILEDDCVPALSFFTFCEELLERYKNDERIWMISGINFFEHLSKPQDSYFYSKYPVIWGWATWKRVWDEYDYTISKWPSFVNEKYVFDDLSEEQGDYALEYYKGIHAINNEKRTAWAAQFGFLQWSNRSIGIVPASNLISNIGHTGIHNDKQEWFHDQKIDEDFKIQNHPKFFLRNIIWDNHYFNIFRKKKTIFEKIIRKIRKFY